MKLTPFLILGALALVTLPARADTVQYLPGGKEALAARYQLIASARTSIDLTTFIWDPCSSSTKALQTLLARKAREGVRVRLLIDAFNPTHQFKQRAMSDAWRAGMAEQMSRAGIELRYYMDTGYLPNVNQRMHAKVLVVDGKAYLTGGRNAQDDYFGLAEGLNWVDRDALVAGASARQASAAFEELWKAREVSVPARANAQAFAAFSAQCLRVSARDRAVAQWLETAGARAASTTAAVRCDSAAFHLDASDFAEGVANETDARVGDDFLTGERYWKKRTTRAVMAELGAARKGILMENFSFLPPARLVTILAEKRQAGIPVKVFTNLATDSRILESRMATRSAEENHGSVRVKRLCPNREISDRWELSSRQAGTFWVIHAKDFVIDDRNVVVSSWNVDARSYGTNLESALVVRDCQDLAKVVARPVRAYSEEETAATCVVPGGGTATSGERFLGGLLQEFL